MSGAGPERRVRQDGAVTAMRRYWSDAKETFIVNDCWGAQVHVEDDPEVGVIVTLRPQDHRTDDDKIMLTMPDINAVLDAIGRIVASRPLEESER